VAPAHASDSGDPLTGFAAPVRAWFCQTFAQASEAQRRGWPPILAGQSTLLLAPTGSGKTLAAFLAAINRLMFTPEPARREGCRLLYVSPLKALAVDVERNLRVPIAGIAAVAHASGVPFRLPTIAIRTGDTPASERARMVRTPPDILITTPESLYLILTSAGREMLAPVETVIVDEIHSLASTKRGAHLFLSLERLEAWRRQRCGVSRPLQRIGLSATQRPLEEVARLLGGGDVEMGKEAGGSSVVAGWRARPVTIIDAGRKKAIEVTVEVPVEDMARLVEGEDVPRRSIWPSIYPRLVELIRAHRSTMIFANSRRLAEQLANALNETAGGEIALAHHGSIAREKRQQIEERLKRGDLPAIVATSSLELGIDMGAVDLVVQIEAPPSVAAGLQRIGRAGHRMGAVSRGVMFPKYRGDLLACAAATALMREGRVEETFYPRNPLDVLAQQLVAIVALEPARVDDLYALVRRAAPFADLPRATFDGVLDMLAGRYPSAEFAELRPRLVWDRAGGAVRAREGARRLAVANAGTIPDRGLYGVFLSGDTGKASRRVGELDEEMVFESRVGEVFLLGASSWRIQEITADQVRVSPAPGEPGKMPFWHGDRPGRPLELGRAIGALVRALGSLPYCEARRRLCDGHGLAARAADNLLAYLDEQKRATGEVPSDRAVVIERFRDELGDWRVCVLSPFGARIHAPWATAVVAQWKAHRELPIDTLWSDDGLVFRLPETADPPDFGLFLPAPAEVEELVTRDLPHTSLFAAHFRENAARALLLPRRKPGRRTPLWAQRKRAAGLLAAAARYGSFPLILETYRECLRDVFDLPGLVEVLRQVADRRVRVVEVNARAPSPFAASLLFSYVANFIYDGDAPLAERRAQVLALDQTQLRELLGEAELRELLDVQVLAELEAALQRLDGLRPVRSADELHDLLRALGDLTEPEIQRRLGAAKWLRTLWDEQRALRVAIAGEPRFIAAEDAPRYRDALGVIVPPGLPAAFLEPVADPLGDLISRYARTHGPFRSEAVATRFGLDHNRIQAVLERLAGSERVLAGEFRPGGRAREWCDAEVLRALKRRSLAKLRKEVEPVEPAVLGRFLLEWQGLSRPRGGSAALLAAIARLQGAPIAASVLERDVLPARVSDYRVGDLDSLCAAGEVLWRGLGSLGPRDGRIALYFADKYPLLAPPAAASGDDLAAEVRRLLTSRGALFFNDLLAAMRGPRWETLAALWSLVWAGEVTNDTLAPLRSLVAPMGLGHRCGLGGGWLSRCAGLPGSEGRWSLLPARAATSETERRTALAQQLLDRQGVLTREAVQTEGITGGFATVYEVLKALEERGRVRRGYFVAGLGATQFALPGAAERLRALRELDEPGRTLVVSAADPANPYGAALPWPVGDRARPNVASAASDPAIPGAAVARPQRVAGAQVVLRDGALVGWLSSTERSLLTFLPSTEPDRTHAATALAAALADLVETGRRRALFVRRVNGEPVADSFLSQFLIASGFTSGSRGYLKRRREPWPTGIRPHRWEFGR
jgi:ATP-dependent Lhr-like helicase